MPALDITALARFYTAGEIALSDERPFLVDRTALATIAGVSTYELPDYVRSIRRVTWKGSALDPLPRRSLRDAFQPATSQGKPFWYVYNNIGLNKIQLFPVPSETVTAPAATTLWSTGIATGVIVEYNRISDNSAFVLPSFIKRQLLKQYVAKQCFLVDGPSNNIKLNQYFSKRFELRKQEWFDLLDDLFSKPRKLGLSGLSTSNYFPGSPVLPISRYGISVDAGE